jgi:hypothetical protein
LECPFWLTFATFACFCSGLFEQKHAKVAKGMTAIVLFVLDQLAMEIAQQSLSARLDRWGLPVCLFIAVALRVLVMWWHADELSRDRDAYVAIARCVADGKGYVDVDRLTPTAFRPPVYPLQLAGLMVLLPVGAAVAVLNLVWGAVSVWATFRAGHWLGLRTGCTLAALLVAVDPMLLLYSAQPMTEVNCAGLVALLVFWIVRHDRAEPVRQLVVGVLFGALVLCRPTFWPMAGLALVGWSWSWLVRRRHGIADTADAPAESGVIPWRMIVGTMLLVVPWVVRNQWVIGSPILTTTHGGYTLLLANNPVFYTEVVDHGFGSEWGHASFEQWTADLQASLTSQLGPNASEPDRDRWQSLRARGFIAAEPGRFLRAAWFRVRSLWSTTPQNEAAANTGSRLVQCVGWYYTGELLAFVLGMLVVTVTRLARRGSHPASPWWPLLGLVLTVQLVHLVYWTNARMRAPIVPVIGLLVVAGLRCSVGPSPSAPPDPSVTPAR